MWFPDQIRDYQRTMHSIELGTAEYININIFMC